MADKGRDARVAEEARLESVYTCQRVSRVRIPVSPPSPAIASATAGSSSVVLVPTEVILLSRLRRTLSAFCFFWNYIIVFE